VHHGSAVGAAKIKAFHIPTKRSPSLPQYFHIAYWMGNRTCRSRSEPVGHSRIPPAAVGNQQLPPQPDKLQFPSFLPTRRNNNLALEFPQAAADRQGAFRSDPNRTVQLRQNIEAFLRETWRQVYQQNKQRIALQEFVRTNSLHSWLNSLNRHDF
jgi:hypothetical protein